MLSGALKRLACLFLLLASSETGAAEVRDFLETCCRWRLEFDDGATLYSTNAVLRSEDRRGGEVVRTYATPDATVVVHLRMSDSCVEMRGKIKKAAKTVRSFRIPDGLRFPGDRVARIIVPQSAYGLGVAFNHAFLEAEREYDVEYPSAFCDVMHVDLDDGEGWSLYGVQPHGVKEFRPSALGVRGSPGAAELKHVWRTYVRAGETYLAPTLVLRKGRYEDALAAYAASNKLGRPFGEKAGKLADKLKFAPLVKLVGSIAYKTRLIDYLPAPTLIHTSDHLPAGMDKLYPEHTPPRKAFGTPSEYRAWLDLLHQRGLLYMPYTNPTWWCDHPRCQTFLDAGEAGLCVKADGKPDHELYGFVTVDGVRSPKD